MLPMINEIRSYDWGSPDGIPAFTGIANPAGEPMAELWMGAHPAAPSRVRRAGGLESLEQLIGRDPEGVLGAAVSRRFARRLPFLFKILSAGRALSIQAHPSLEQAREGFARENEAGIPLDAFERSYRDDNHKPELIRALTPFTALRGFRPHADIAADFAGPEFDVLRDAVDALAAHRDAATLRGFFTALMEADAETVAAASIARAERAGAATSSPGADRNRGAAEPGAATPAAGLRYEWVLRLHEQFGPDRGIAAPLYLNCLVLEPGEAMFLPAGTLHAYLAGTGIEIMANSDNVLRGGLTGKHVNVPELIRTLRFEPDEPIVQRAPPPGEGGAPDPPAAAGGAPWHRYDSPVPEFALEEARVEGRLLRDRRPGVPEILLVLDGAVLISEEVDRDAGNTPETAAAAARAGARSRHMEVPRGGSVFVPAASGPYTLDGSARVFVATVPPAEAGGPPI